MRPFGSADRRRLRTSRLKFILSLGLLFRGQMVKDMEDREKVEERLGYQFKNEHLRRLALTHSSTGTLSNEDRDQQKRLAWLGDSILDFVVAEDAFRRHPKATRGDLHQRRQALTNTQALNRAGARLGNFPSTGTSVNRKLSAEPHPRMMATAIEILVGAVYLEAGIERVRALVIRLVDGELNR